MVVTVCNPPSGNKAMLGFTHTHTHTLILGREDNSGYTGCSKLSEGYEIKVIEAMGSAHTGTQAAVVLTAVIMLSVG